MRWIFFLLLAIGFSFSGFSQQDLVPFKKDQLWGYCDRNGKEVLVPQFHVAFPFYNSYALVFKESESGSGGTWGYISLDGKWIESGPLGVSHSRIPKDVFPNKEGWVEVYLADRKGNLTKKFFLLTAPKMVDQQEENSDTNLSNQEAKLKDGKWYYPSVNSSAQLI
ncbi:MAG: WG repeat-containing protein [Flavobacteriales bacterium]